MSANDSYTKWHVNHKPNHTITVRPAQDTDDREWGIGAMTVEQVRGLNEGHKVKVVARLPNGKQDEFRRLMSIRMLRECSPALDDAVFEAGLVHEQIGTVIFQVTDFDALATVLNHVHDIVTAHRGVIRDVGIQYKTPFYTYFQIAQVAQALVMRPILSEVTRRISAMRYGLDEHERPQTRNRQWGIQVTDMKRIYATISDPNHWVRYHISKSIAMANVDQVLRNEDVIHEWLKANPEILSEIVEIADKIKAYRERVAAARVRRE